MCPITNGSAGFWLRACIWIPSETLEPAFHRVFIWHLTGEEDSCYTINIFMGEAGVVDGVGRATGKEV